MNRLLLAFLALLAVVQTGLAEQVEFGSAIQLTLADSIAFQLDTFAGSDGGQHLTWNDRRSGGFEIYYGELDGTTFVTEVAIAGGTNPENPCIAVSNGGTICVVWEDLVNNLFQIFSSFSTDAGATWSTPVELSFATVNAMNADLVLESDDSFGVVYMALSTTDSELYYAKWNGASWSTPTQITDSGGDATHPDAIAEADTVHVAWQDTRDGNDEIYHATLLNGTVTMTERLTNDASYSWQPRLALMGDTLLVGYNDKRDGDFQIFLQRRIGGVWNPEEKLTEGINDSKFCHIATGSQSRIYVVWQDLRLGSHDVVFKMWGGNAWCDDVLVATETDNDGEAHIFVAGDELTAVWSRFYDGTANQADLFCATATALPVSSIGESGTLTQRLVAYPNPSRGTVQIFAQGVDVPSLPLAIWDAQGRRIWSGELSRGGTSWNPEQSPSGVYFLRTPDERQATKLIISR